MIVNSHNGWDPLEEVIVGDGFPTELPTLDFSFRLFFHDNIYGKEFHHGDAHKYITKRHVEEHQEDVESLADLLKSLGVIVRRSKRPTHIHKTKTPWWESTIYPALNVRDQCLIVGDTIIETPSTCRWRYYENDFIKHLFLEYFNKGAKWIQAPRPLMLDSSFDLSYVNEETGAKDYYNVIKDDEPHYMDMGYEIMFDGANCIRLGKHIIINASNENQRLGAKWLQSTLGDDYVIWPVDICDNHMDSTLLPLRPGLALVPQYGTNIHAIPKLPKEMHNWDFVFIPGRNQTREQREHQGIKLASPRIELNVLSVSPDLIICHPEYEEILRQQLKKYKIDVVSSPMRHCEVFGGAHHCSTLDIRRKSKLENYFD